MEIITCNHDKFAHGDIGEECIECGLLRSTVEALTPTNQPIEEKWKEEFNSRFTQEWWTGFGTTSDIDRRGRLGIMSFIENLLEQERKRMSEEIEKLEKERWPRAVYSDDILSIINK